MIPCSTDPDCTLFCMPRPGDSIFKYDIFGRIDFIPPPGLTGKVYK